MAVNSQGMDAEMDLWKSTEGFCLSRSNTSDSLNSLSSVPSSATSTTRSKAYFCDYEGCNKAFTRPSLLTEHQASVHQGRKPFRCQQCDRSFSKKSHLERHIYAHSDQKPLHCSYCDKGFTTRQQLRRHEITHTKSFACPYTDCNEAFYKHPQLRSHILAVHEKKLTCKICGKNFQRPYRLHNHVAKHHNPEVENPYQCSFASCAKNFKTWSQLQTHVRNDHPKLRCSICDKPCVGEAGLQMHMKVHDDSVVTRNWKCGICDDMAFPKKSDMLAHYSSEHHENSAEFQLQQDCSREKGFESSNKAADSPLIEVKRRKINDLDLIKSQTSLERYFSEGKGGMNLLLRVVGRKLRCPYDKCYRTFKTEERYQKHIDKHKIHQLKLKVLQEKKDSTEPETVSGCDGESKIHSSKGNSNIVESKGSVE